MQLNYTKIVPIPVKFPKFLRTSILKNFYERLILRFLALKNDMEITNCNLLVTKTSLTLSWYLKGYFWAF